MAGVLPVELLYLFDAEEVETLICGSSDVSVSFLKSVTEYDGVSPSEPHIQMFWYVAFFRCCCMLTWLHLTVLTETTLPFAGRCCRS